MFLLTTWSRLGRTLCAMCIVGLLASQTAILAAQIPIRLKPLPPAPARTSIAFDDFLNSTIRQERRLTILMRNFKPIVETYVQEEKIDSNLRTSPRNDDYFLSRIDLAGKNPVAVPFVQQSGARSGDWKNAQPFDPAGFAEAMFPDLDHFDRQNYAFKFVRWEALGELRCAVIDAAPRDITQNRGFVGRIWVEDQDYNVVRFTGTYTSKTAAKRAYHFDSWRLNTLSIMWMPAYIYTEESNPNDLSHRGPWFKAQSRIWGYDLENAGDHREFAKPLTDDPVWVDPKRHEASQDLNPAFTLGKSIYPPDDDVVERLQVAGLMAPDGDVDKILETVTNNLLITNDLDLENVRCRVLLTTPLESFVMGRTIVLSRGLLDVLPDEATLAAVLAHELAHIVLKHSLATEYLEGIHLPFSDLEIFNKLTFHFDATQEADADRKALELFSKSPYKDQLANARLFLESLQASAAQLPNLLHGRFSNDFASSHLVRMTGVVTAPRHPPMNSDQIAALPLGSRISLDPWSDRIEMLKAKPVRQLLPSEKIPFEVSAFFPYLKRLQENKKAQAAGGP